MSGHPCRDSDGCRRQGILFGRRYAREKGYIIGEKALLKLYLLAGGVDTGDAAKAVESIRGIVDDAIEHGSRKGKRRTSRKNGGLIILKDKDFIS